MELYLLIFIIAVAIYLFSTVKNERSKLVLGIYLTGLALFVGCADMLGGYDRYIYGEVFDQMAMVSRNDGNLLATAGYRIFSSEWGFLGFNQLMGYLTLNRYIFIFTLTIIIYTLLFISIAQYCENYPFAVIVFLGLWFFFTFTYLRQVTAATIGWLAIRYAIERKPIPFFAIVLLAFSFHNSAIVLAPLYFLPKRVFSKGTIVLVLVICLLIGMSNVLGGIIGASDIFMDEQKVQENINNIEDGSFRVAYFLESLFFISFIFLNYELFNENDRRQTLLLNMALVFCAILLLFARSENGGRMAWHYMIGIIATISSIIHRTSRRQLYSTVLIFLMLALYIRILNAWQWSNSLYPYKTFFTNGYRTPDYIHDHYEYDQQYDVNKFYK